MERLPHDVITAANEKSRRLRELVLAPEILVMPGAWDALTAILFERLGFQAIQGSSAAIAAVLGQPDGEVLTREQTGAATKEIAGAVSVPVNADGEAGYGGPDETAATVRAFVEARAAGMNLEDSIPSGPTGSRPWSRADPRARREDRGRHGDEAGDRKRVLPERTRRCLRRDA